MLSGWDKVLRGLVWLVSYIPPKVLRMIGRGIGLLVLQLDKKHRRIIMENLRLSFPEKDEGWINATARACMENLGQVAVELALLYRLSPEEIWAQTRHHGAEKLRNALAQGKGVLLLSGHIGNWEWASLSSAYDGHKAMIVARPLDWPPADRLVYYIRTRIGHSMAPKQRSARILLRTLKAKGLAVALLDQNVDWYEGEWVDFFGRPACSNKGLALLAMATEAPVVSYYCFRAPDGKFDVYYNDPIPLVKTGDKLSDVWANTQNYTRALEEIIRKRPDQWFWMHQRWKTKPYQPWPRVKK